MLRSPYTKYDQVHMYHLDLPELPPLNDPDLIGAWIEDNTAVIFYHRDKERFIQELCHQSGCSIIYQAQIGYDEWETGQEISTFKVGDLTISPLWEKTTADIKFDPSIIFGSGFHPSTRLCLETVAHYFALSEIPPTSVMDLGTGTGLLAITAAKLGAQRILAVDNNSLACEVARKNASVNNVDDKITVKLLDLRKEYPDGKVDLIIANLYHGLLVDLFNDPAFWRADLHIIAGFIPAMEPELLSALPSIPLKLLERKQADRWCLWVLKKSG